MMSALPKKYSWMNDEAGPKHMVEAIRHFGIMEHVGKGSNTDIMTWAKETGVSGWYGDDDIPWCGLFVGVCMKRAGWPIKTTLLSALSWGTFGNPVKPSQAGYGDLLVFVRPGGGHVGFYVAENDKAYLVYGGNQSNAVGFAFIEKKRLKNVRRPAWKVAQPDNVRKIAINETGSYSKNEV